MPILIDEIDTQVQLIPAAPDAPAAGPAPAQPWDLLAQQRQSLQTLLREAQRTAACGNDD